MIKTFRGLLADDGQDRIRLQTIKGKVGYRITKLELFANNPGAQRQESILKIYKEEQTAVDGVVDYTDSAMLASGYYADDPGGQNGFIVINVFDTEIFNQDIYITHSDVVSSQAVNYYLELEVIPLDDAGAEYTTLKDMRSV